MTSRWFLLALMVSVVDGAEYLLQSFRGHVYAGNYTYYRLSLDGDVILVLESLNGDCDLYISQHKLHPTYDLEEHCLQSTTCGSDRVCIPASFRRPVGVGVYGHPSWETSQYELKVILDDSPDVQDYYAEGGERERRDNLNLPPPHTGKSDSEESFLWTLFVGFLRLLLEVLTS